jgi:Ca-activated chloride channel family protein
MHGKFSTPAFAICLALCLTLSSIALPLPVSLAVNHLTEQNASDKNLPSNNDRQDDKAAAQKPSADNPLSRDQKDRIRLETKLVSTVITVSDPYGRFVTGLEKENFEIYDDNVKQDIAIFSDEDSPITLGIVYDVSGSMGDLTSQSFQALRRFFHTSHEDDEYFIIAFNKKPHLVQDFTNSPSEILNRTVFIEAKGNTALYDAVYLATEKVKYGRHAKKALLIISDGHENSSRYSGKELGTLLKESDVQIYGIGIGEGAVAKGVLELAGGRVYSGLGIGEVGNIYVRMALLLRHQYVVGFYPTDTTSATKWHQVKVKVVAPKGLGRLSLSYKKGYQSFAQ